jgi:hypothetical protein
MVAMDAHGVTTAVSRLGVAFFKFSLTKAQPFFHYKMVDVSDSALAEAYQDVRSDKTETNW